MTRANYGGVSRQRGVAVVSTLVLTLALGLSGCGGRGAQGQNNYGSGGASTGTSSSGSGGSTLEVQSADQQVQNALVGLDNTESSATNAESTSQEGTALP